VTLFSSAINYRPPISIRHDPRLKTKKEIFIFVFQHKNKNGMAVIKNVGVDCISFFLSFLRIV
jgi:hypothetical protein